MGSLERGSMTTPWPEAQPVCSQLHRAGAPAREHIFGTCPYAQAVKDVLVRNLPEAVSVLPVHV
eukprot:1160399-Pelagomonas_calceolata.AAC.3